MNHRTLQLLLLAVVFSLMASCGSTFDIESAVEKARDKMDAGKFKEAISLLDKVIDEAPNNDEALNMRGVAYVNLASYGKALSDFNTAIAQNASQYMYYYNRGNVKRNLKQPRKAIEDYSKAIAIDEDRYQVWLNRALSYASVQQLDSAHADFQQAISKGGEKDPQLFYYHAKVLISMEQYEQAVTAAAACLKISPEYALGHYTMGLAKLGAGHPKQEACRHLTQAVSLGYAQGRPLLEQYCGETLNQ